MPDDAPVMMAVLFSSRDNQFSIFVK